MKVEGQCRCGQIRFEAEIDLDTVGICHRTDWQTLTGSAYRVSPVPWYRRKAHRGGLRACDLDANRRRKSFWRSCLPAHIASGMLCQCLRAWFP